MKHIKVLDKMLVANLFGRNYASTNENSEAVGFLISEEFAIGDEIINNNSEYKQYTCIKATHKGIVYLTEFLNRHSS